MTPRSHVKHVSTIITASIAVAVAMAGLGPNPIAAQGATAVYLVAVGDIACDPSPKGDPNYYPAYKNGNGTPDGCRHQSVAAAVIAAKPDQFWALGDNQYFDGTFAKYMESYDRLSARSRALRVPSRETTSGRTSPSRPSREPATSRTSAQRRIPRRSARTVSTRVTGTCWPSMTTSVT
jgi:hypothetical protein